MPNWVFERQTRDGGAAGEAVPNAVEAGGWSCTEELLVREAIQNSVDAGVEGNGAVKVTFRVQHHVEADKAKMLKALDLVPFIERCADNALKLPAGTVLDQFAEPSVPLNLLYVEDRNTTGLGGGLSDRIKGNFFRLLFLIGDGSKADVNDGSGGSFGFGKGVYAYSSNIRTIFVFSVFEASEATDGQWARLLGCSYLPSHDYSGSTWTGRAWFGIPGDGTDGQSPYPLINEEACRYAESLGFSMRERNDIGTSILIVGCDSSDGDMSVDKIKAAAETWWWPRVTDGDLQVELIDQGVRHPGLDPVNRLDLEPYIKARNCLLGRDRSDSVTMPPFRGSRGYQLGDLALMAITPDHPSFESLTHAQSEGEDRQGKTPAHRTIAYIRQPGMVVTYQSWSLTSTVSAIGVFQAHKDVDRHLKLSEPVEHDRWDQQSRRLLAVESGAEIVGTVQRKCKKNLRDFLKGLQPPPPPPRGGLDWLGKLLGQILTPRDRAPPPAPDGDRGIVSIQTESEPMAIDEGEGMVKLQARYSIGLKPQNEQQRMAVVFSPRLHVLEGDIGTKGGLLTLAVRELNGEAVSGEKPDITVELDPEQRCSITIESEPYAVDWAVSLHIEASASELEIA